MNEKLKIISLYINPITFEESLHQVIELGLSRKPSFICFANVHMAIEAYKDMLFSEQLNKATLVLADGKPIAAACSWFHKKKQERIPGMEFMPRLLKAADNIAAKIFLFGSTDEVLKKLKNKIQSTYPNIDISGTLSPPFRKLTEEEELSYIHEINQSSANFVLVSLGCPKQEKWMSNNYSKINATMLGVGAAFAVTAGIQKRSPHLMQQLGLEWLYRLYQEPSRLFKRYFTTNTLFLYLSTKEWLRVKFNAKNETH